MFSIIFVQIGILTILSIQAQEDMKYNSIQGLHTIGYSITHLVRCPQTMTLEYFQAAVFILIPKATMTKRS